MELSKLYEEYGKLIIELEILQGKINGVKRQIAEELNSSMSTLPVGNKKEQK